MKEHEPRAAAAASPSAEREVALAIWRAPGWEAKEAAVREYGAAAYARGLGMAARECDAVAEGPHDSGHVMRWYSNGASECARAIRALAGSEAQPPPDARVKELEGALRDLFGFLESGDLVRCTARDDEPEWALRSMNLVMALKRAQTLLGASDPAKRKP